MAYPYPTIAIKTQSRCHRPWDKGNGHEAERASLRQRITGSLTPRSFTAASARSVAASPSCAARAARARSASEANGFACCPHLARVNGGKGAGRTDSRSCLWPGPADPSVNGYSTGIAGRALEEGW